MPYHKGFFSVPSSWMPKDIERGNEKVVVVSVFGQSSVDSNGYKTSPLEMMLGKNVLGRSIIRPISFNEDIFTGIEGYYDPERRIVFLHLAGVLDAATLQKSLVNLNDQLQEKGFLVVWSELRLEYARALLLLFCVSHILLLSHPSHIFDITYIHLFRTLDTVRSKFQQSCSELLKGVSGVSKEWLSNGRVCSPRVLFLFSSRLIPAHVIKDALNAKSGGVVNNRFEKGGSSPLRKLELDLEYQIYRLLRKSRVITNVSANSLFALPNNQPFVYVTDECHDFLVAPSLIRDTLKDMCSVTPRLSTPKPAPYSFPSSPLPYPSFPPSPPLGAPPPRDPSFVSPLSDPGEADALSHALLSSMSTEKKRNLEHSFSLFLKQHIDEALTRGFDDSVGRHATPNFFEVPKVSVWFEAVHRLHSLFVQEPCSKNNHSNHNHNNHNHSNRTGEPQPQPDDKEKQVRRKRRDGDNDKVISSLRSSLETDIRFSDARCAKVLPLAVSAYKEGLPPHYTRGQHQAKLDVALSLLSCQSRGPMYAKYVRELEGTCALIWSEGRVGCEVTSLTGKTCHHPRHRVKGEKGKMGEEDGDTESSHLPVLSHNSNVVYMSYCNCGRHQGPAEDPFGPKVANYDFYAKMNDNFCAILEEFPFPSFKSSVDHATAAEVSPMPLSSARTWSPSGDLEVRASDRRSTLKDDPNLTVTPQSPLGLSLECAGLSQGGRVPPPTPLPPPVEEGHEIIVTVKEEVEEEEEEEAHGGGGGGGAGGEKKRYGGRNGYTRAASTTEYLPWMLTATSPPGLLPLFPSWSLVCLGPSSLYSHNAGICEQPGFLPGTNFLLPWDVTIKIRDKDKWPAIAESMGKKGFLLKNKKNRMGGDLSEFSVKIFLGTEYQCQRGHRFMMAAPDRHLKASNLGHVKDTAIKISNSDMPLYFPCPCSRRGSYMPGQLLRLHVVTPKAPVHVTLDPRVHPSPSPTTPTFIPQPLTSSTIKLSASAYWVLRLPFVYVGEGGAYPPPSPYHGNPASYGRLVKGCYGISEITLDR